MVENLPAMRETCLDPWVRKILWRRKWQPTPAFLPGKFSGQRSLMGYSPWGRKRVRRDLATKKTRVMALAVTGFPSSSAGKEFTHNARDLV